MDTKPSAAMPQENPNETEVDRNLLEQPDVEACEMTEYTLPDAHFDLYGLQFSEKDRFFRLPQSLAAQVNEGVLKRWRNTAGGRLRFCTDAKLMRLTLRCRTLAKLTHMANSGSSGFALAEVTENGYRYAAIFRRSATDTDGYTVTMPLRGEKMREYVLFFPLYNEVDELKIAVNADAALRPGRRYAHELPIVYYGSSITQGACATTPMNAYQAYLSEWNDSDYLNFGFSGSARGETVLAEYLAGIPASIFVMDYDFNAKTVDWLRATHEPFFLAYRALQPKTPVVFFTRCSIEKEGSSQTYAERRDIIRTTYENALRRGDENVRFVDGSEVFAPDRGHCTVDGTHPNDLGFYRMAKALQPTIAELLAGK